MTCGSTPSAAQLFVDELVRIFDERPPRSGGVWAIGFAQLVPTVTASILLATAVALRRWESFLLVAKPRLNDYGGKSKSWMLHTDFLHPKSGLDAVRPRS